MEKWEYILEEIEKAAVRGNLSSQETEVFMEFIVCRFGEMMHMDSYYDEWAQRISRRRAYSVSDKQAEECLEKAGYDELPFPEKRT